MDRYSSADLDDVTNEFRRVSENTDRLAIDLVTTNNIVRFTKLLLKVTDKILVKAEKIPQDAGAIEKAAALLSKAPKIGLLFKSIEETAKASRVGAEYFSDTANNIATVLRTAEKSLFPLSLFLLGAEKLTNDAGDDANDRLETVEEFLSLPIGQHSLLPIDLVILNSLHVTNNKVDELLTSTAPFREKVIALENSIEENALSILEEIDSFLDQVDSIFSAVREPLKIVEEALAPVDWALDAADSVIDATVGPVVDALLEATGIDQVLEEATSKLTGMGSAFELLGEIQPSFERLYLNNDVGKMVNDLWSPAVQIQFEAPEGSIFKLGEIGAIKVDLDGEGRGVAWLGSNDDDVLNGTERDDIFAPNDGDDQVEAGGGSDLAIYLHDITEVRLELPTDTQVKLTARADADIDVGVDRLYDVERFRFDTVGLGEVTRSDIEKFQYTDPPSGIQNLTGGDGVDWLLGDTRDNELKGEGGNDFLFGGAGNDTLNGGAGDDQVFAGDGDDFVVIGQGVDNVYGGEGRDTVLISDEVLDPNSDIGVVADLANGGIDLGIYGIAALQSIEEISGTTRGDIFRGSSAAETVFNGRGGDRFEAMGEGDEFFHGLPSTLDTFTATASFEGGGYQGVRIAVYNLNDRTGAGTQASHNDQSTFRLGNENFGALKNIKVFEGTALGDVFYAHGVRDNGRYDGGTITYTLPGSGGDTVEIDGAVFRGGLGADVFFASEQSNVFDGGEGFDLVNYNLDKIISTRLSDGQYPRGIIANLGTGIVEILDSSRKVVGENYLIGIEGIVGTDGRDTLIGSDEANYLFGYLGNDTLMGMGGDDYIDGAYGFGVGVVLDGGEGNDVVALGSAENAQAIGGAGIDTLELKADQAFRIDAYRDEEVAGTISAQEFNTGGWTVVLGPNGSATSEFKNASDVGDPNVLPFTRTTFLNGFENVFGSDFDDDISGDVGENLLIGRDGNDTINGGGGNDILQGGLGSDVLSGGDGDDILSGGVNFVDGEVSPDQVYDKLEGGGGNDVFRIDPTGDALSPAAAGSQAANAVRILDFTVTDDKIDLVPLGVVSFDAVTWELGSINSEVATNLMVDGKTVAWLLGPDLMPLNETHFLLADPAIAVNDTVILSEDDGPTNFSSVLENDQNLTGGETVALVTGTTQGTLELAPDGSFNYEPGNNLQILAAGWTALDSFVYEITDSGGLKSQARVQITVEGAEDPILIDGVTTGAVAENGTLSTFGNLLVASDIDANDTPAFIAQTDTAGKYGKFNLTQAGLWSYALDDTDGHALAGGEEDIETFVVTARNSDDESATQTVTIIVSGAEDPILITGDTTGAVTEDGVLAASGLFAASDADANDTPAFIEQTETGGQYGSFKLTQAGVWSYTLINAFAQSLAGAQTVTETFGITAQNPDGEDAAETVTISITGAEDPIVIDGDTTGAVAENGALSTVGNLAASDADADDTPAFIAQTDTAGQYGKFNLTQAGIWSYTLDAAAGQDLASGEEVIETFVVTAQNLDGETATQTVTIMVTGAENPILIVGEKTGVVSEDGVLTASGLLIATDADDDDMPTFIEQLAVTGQYGTFSLTAAGAWNYALDNTAAQELSDDDQLLESFSVTAITADGEVTVDTVDITVNGADELDQGTPGADVIRAGDFGAVLEGFEGNDRLYGGRGDDVLDGGRDADQLYGGGGDDILDGGHQSDRLYGGRGDDILDGGSHADRLYGGRGNDILDGGDQSDRLYGGRGSDELFGGEGSDRLYGGRGDDQLDGENGRDWLNGGDGDDVISGGSGRDFIFGGRGNDTFHFKQGNEKDMVFDFRHGEDTLAIDAELLGGVMTGADILSEFATQRGFVTEFDFGGGDELTLIWKGNLIDLADDIRII